MKIQTIKNNRGFTPTPNFKKKGNLVSGFTLVETLFAVLILTFVIVSLMTVVANSLFASRYARDEITVNYLLQEVVDYIRNDRDTTIFLGTGGSWNSFLIKYNNCTTSNGCYFDVLNSTTPIICELDCPYLYYNENADTTPFYVNDDGSGMDGMLKTNFRRRIIVRVNDSNPDEIDVIVTVDWKNSGKDMTRSLQSSLVNWQK